MNVRQGVEPSWKLWLGAWLWVLVLGASLQLYILPATPWHAGHGLLAGGEWVMFQDQALKPAKEVRQQGWSAWTLLSYRCVAGGKK